MKTPIKVQDVWEFAPHRPPMVWVDEILKFSATEGECAVRIKADGLYMGEEGLRASSCLEFIAQSYGFISICFKEFSGSPMARRPKRAFLASFKDAKYAEASVIAGVRPGDELRIKISGARQMGPIIMFHGRVELNEQLLCESGMKVFSED